MAIEVRNILPKNSQSNVPINANIEFDLVGTDGDTIDVATLTVSIETVSLITGDTLSNVYTSADVASVQCQGDSGYYKVFVNPERPFEQGMTVVVKIDVDDNSSAPMTQYSSSFSTVYNNLISDFTYALIYQAQNIPVYNEVLRPNSTTEPQIFDSAFKNWNQKPRVEIKLNQVIINSGYTVDYSNGQVVFDSPMEYNDQVEASYTFRCISDEQIQQYFNQAAALWRIHPPAGGPMSVYNANLTERYIIFLGAAQFAFNDLIFSFAIQEKRVIFDNRSWDDAWKTIMESFKGLRDSYKDMWDKAIEAKKFKLPGIASVVTPEYTMPGGRSRFFRYLYKQGGSGL